MLRVALVLTLFWCGSARAADQAPTRMPITWGLTVALDKDGKVDFRGGEVIWLADGRELHHEGDRWVIVPASDVPVTELKPIDFALYADKYVGRRVRIKGGEIFAASVDSGMLRLPGLDVPIFFHGADREALRYYVEHCAGILSDADCSAEVTATVGIRQDRKITLGLPILAAHDSPVQTH